jgi:hypothetical protein
VDTGASMSVLHSKLSQILPVHNKNKLKPYEKDLKMADGRNIRFLGTVKLPIVLDDQIIWQNFVVAEIDIPVVLVYDFMFENKCVIDIPSQSLVLKNQTIKCELESQIPRLLKISLDQRVTIPGRSEIVLQAKPLKKLPYGTTLIMDTTSPSLKKKGILVAKALYKVGEEKLPLRVMNVTDKPQILYNNTCVGTAETVFHDDILGGINDQEKCVSLTEHLVIDKCKGNLNENQNLAVKRVTIEKR